MINIYEAQAANKRKSAVIIILFAVFVVIAIYVFSQAFVVYWGYEISGFGMIGIALIISGLMSFGGYYFSDRIVLGISGARPADRKRNFKFFTAVENLSIAAGIPKPKLYVIADTATNAFATGRDPDHAVICATTGLIEKLSKTELESVVAHELSHIRNFDTRLMSIVTVLVGMIALLGDMFLRMNFRGRRESKRSGQLAAVFLALGLLFAALSPIIARLIKLAISRRREFFADAGSVALTRQPGGLITALQKISADKEPLEAANKATAHLYIVNPFKNKVKSGARWFAGMFNTHPTVGERISELKKMV